MADAPASPGFITTVAWSPGAPHALAGQGATVRPVYVRAGHVAARHHHEFEQFLYVASGGGTLQGEAGPVTLAPGTALHLPAGAWHSAVFDADTLLVEVNLNPATP